MSNETVSAARATYEGAFLLYIEAASETHRLLSELSGTVTMSQRITVCAQRMRETDAQAAYASARRSLLAVIISK